MAAAAITPTVVQKEDLTCSAKTGTPMRLVRYWFKGTKATDADWIVTDTYFQSTGTIIEYNAITIDSSSDAVQEGTVGLTYTATGTKLTFSGGTTGTVYGYVVYSED